jgi:hypothetical protein
MDPHLKENVTMQTTWIRGLYILLFAIIYSIAEIVVVAVVVFQFLSTLFMGQNNQQLLRLGRSLSDFIRQVLLFVTYNSDEKPFPFGPWPEPGEMALATTPEKKTTKKSTAKKSPPEDSASE